MTENLKATHYRNGDAIPNITNNGDWSGLSTGAYVDYDNNPTNSETYGRLYNWFAVNDERGLCPDNWHVPSDDEFKSLEMYLGMSESEANGEELRGTDEGGKMKETGLDHWNSPNTGATNESGFTGLPAGGRSSNNGNYVSMGGNGYFWSSSESSSVNAWYRWLNYDSSSAGRYGNDKQGGFSIRCLADEITTGCTDPEASNYDPDANVDDGSCCIELWGECYNIEETTELNISDSGLTGEIPPEIGNLTNLTQLRLYSNQLTGEIPSEIGNLTSLTDLRLYNNQLIGEIPSEIWELTSLTFLDLSSNQLTGEIPIEIGNHELELLNYMKYL